MGQVLHIVPCRPKPGLQFWQVEAFVQLEQVFGQAINISEGNSQREILWQVCPRRKVPVGQVSHVVPCKP